MDSSKKAALILAYTGKVFAEPSEAESEDSKASAAGSESRQNETILRRRGPPRAPPNAPFRNEKFNKLEDQISDLQKLENRDFRDINARLCAKAKRISEIDSALSTQEALNQNFLNRTTHNTIESTESKSQITELSKRLTEAERRNTENCGQNQFMWAEIAQLKSNHTAFQVQANNAMVKKVFSKNVFS